MVFMFRRCFGVFLLLLLFVPFVSASVSEVVVSPENPEVGDVVSVSIQADPWEELSVSISFSKVVAVSGGEFNYRLNDVRIPLTPNIFSVTAEPVRILRVAVQIIFWITRIAEDSSGVATISQSNVPPGKYNIRISGIAASRASEVVLTIVGSRSVSADENGYFTYAYDTSNMPTGTYNANVGGLSRSYTLYSPGSAPSVDPSSPVISWHQPTDTVDVADPAVSASFSDDMGIDVDSVVLLFDEVDVTGSSTVSSGSVSYAASGLVSGSDYMVELRVSDTSGNEAVHKWSFTVDIPETPPVEVPLAVVVQPVIVPSRAPRAETIAGIIIIAVAVILYANSKGIFPFR